MGLRRGSASLYQQFWQNLQYRDRCTNGQWLAYIVSTNLFLLDRTTGSNVNVSVIRPSDHAGLRFSDDARYLVYATSGTNSLSLKIDNQRNVYVYDLLTQSNSLVSRSFFTGRSSSGNSDAPDISADGRFIAYESDSSELVPSDVNQAKDVFLFDRQTSSTVLLSASVFGQGTADFHSFAPRFTGDGETLTFQTWASDVFTNDFNQLDELLLVRLYSASNPAPTNPAPVLVGQIVFTSASGAGGTTNAPQLTWASAPGVGYQVQYKTNLTDPDWLPINGSVVIENGQGYVQDLTPDPDHRFYRIVAQ